MYACTFITVECTYTTVRQNFTKISLSSKSKIIEKNEIKIHQASKIDSGLLTASQLIGIVIDCLSLRLQIGKSRVFLRFEESSLRLYSVILHSSKYILSRKVFSWIVQTCPEVPCARYSAFVGLKTSIELEHDIESLQHKVCCSRTARSSEHFSGYLHAILENE